MGMVHSPLCRLLIFKAQLHKQRSVGWYLETHSFYPDEPITRPVVYILLHSLSRSDRSSAFLTSFPLYQCTWCPQWSSASGIKNWGNSCHKTTQQWKTWISLDKKKDYSPTCPGYWHITCLCAFIYYHYFIHTLPVDGWDEETPLHQHFKQRKDFEKQILVVFTRLIII